MLKRTINKDKAAQLRKTFQGKADFRGLKFTVKEATEKTYLIEMRHQRLNITAYQVIDNDKSGQYPHNNKELELLNVFRTNHLKEAKENFNSRKN